MKLPRAALLLAFLLALPAAAASPRKTWIGAGASAKVSDEVGLSFSETLYFTRLEDLTSFEDALSLNWFATERWTFGVGETISHARVRRAAPEGGPRPDRHWRPSHSQALSATYAPVLADDFRLTLRSRFSWNERHSDDYGLFRENVRAAWRPLPGGSRPWLYFDWEGHLSGTPAYSGDERLCQSREKVGVRLPLGGTSLGAYAMRRHRRSTASGDWLHDTILGLSVHHRF